MYLYFSDLFFSCPDVIFIDPYFHPCFLIFNRENFNFMTFHIFLVNLKVYIPEVHESTRSPTQITIKYIRCPLVVDLTIRVLDMIRVMNTVLRIPRSTRNVFSRPIFNVFRPLLRMVNYPLLMCISSTYLHRQQ